MKRTGPISDANYDSLLKDLDSWDKLLSQKPEVTEKLYRQFLNPVFSRISRFIGMNVRFVEARGCCLRDQNGQEYLDFLSGFGALNFGHEPPEILEALRLAEGKPNFLQSYMNPFTAKLGELLAAVTPDPLTRSFFCNSGTEAVEAALKLARIATGRQVLLSTAGAYHGKTFGALSVSGKSKYRKPFEPLLPGTETVPYDDLPALAKRLERNDVAGFIVEPIQGENGVIIPKTGYLKGAEELCRRHETLFMVDEIQTGIGRTGRLFAFEHEGVVPDVLILSKSLGGGIMPIGAIVTTDPIWKAAYGSFDHGLLHSTTFGGNTRACVCAIAAIRLMLKDRLFENAANMGRLLLEKLSELQKETSLLREVRGKGLMIGLGLARLKGKSAITEGALTLWVARQLLKKYRIITAFTMNNLDVLRIAPPLIINPDHIEYFIQALRDVLKSAGKLKFFGLIRSQ